MSEQSVADPDVGYRITHDEPTKIRAAVDIPSVYGGTTESAAAVALPWAGSPKSWMVLLFDRALNAEAVVVATRDDAARLVRLWAPTVARTIPAAVAA